MVIYGAMTNTSVAAMFAGAIIPGILIGLAQMVVVFVQAKRRNFPKHYIEFTPTKFLLSFRAAFLALIMPLIILSGILFGLTTPTEAAAIAALYAFILGVFYRNLTFRKTVNIFKGATYQYASLLMIMGSASILGWVLSRVQAHTVLLKLIFGVTQNPTGILLIVLCFLLFVGTWLETGATIVLLAPTLAAAMHLIGYHPVHFGIVMTVTANIGLLTPPLGVCLFAASATGKISVEAIVSEIWPFIGAAVVILLMIALLPEISLFLPRLLGLV
jgi:tripartite ATP-independent transporter DctM subunit